MTTPKLPPTGTMAALAGTIACVLACSAGAQDTSETRIPPLFARETPLAVTFSVNIQQLRRDKTRTAPWRAATLTYIGADSAPVRVPVRAKTHGIWRLAHCDFPPVRLNFSGKNTKTTVFTHLDRPKLTNFCHDNDRYEQYVLQELQLYRIYQLLTPISHRVRLLRVSYVDSAAGKTETTRYAFLLEDPERMAARLSGRLFKQKGAGANDFDPEQLGLAYLFEYLVGNTDFSFNQLHNAEIVALTDGRYLPIAYDFDFAGAVDAPYATPDPSIRITRVRQRRFRGYCAINEEYPKLFPLFQAKKAAIYALYSDEVGRLMDPRIVRQTLDYFDEFYQVIGNPRDAESNILGDCRGPR
jgi:hypothetical protein